MSSKKRVAVTGGSGKIGHAVCEALVARGDEVFNLDRRMPEKPAGKFVFCDLRQRAQFQPVFEQVDAVCHLGELPHPRASSPEDVFGTNTTVGSLVMQTAAEVKVKQLIYTSSCQAYGQWDWPTVPPTSLPFDETMPLQPQNCYALSKMANENYARLVARKNPEMCIAAFRFPWVIIDPLQHRWMRELLGEPVTFVEGFGTYLHVSDAVTAYLGAIDNPRPGFEAYHFAAAKVRHSKPLRQLMEKFNPDYPPLPPDWPDQKSPVITDKAKSHLGWEPKWDLRDYLTKQAQSAQNSQ